MRDLDRGLLGRGSHGLQQYEMLRRGTDALVNGILRVRRLLKQKRTADADGTPVPHPDVHPGPGFPTPIIPNDQMTVFTAISCVLLCPIGNAPFLHVLPSLS